MRKQHLYFDTAATTPIDSKVIDLMHKINIESFGNPSSIHSIGQKSHNIIERSRIKISEILSCKSSEIYFTSGGSESNNIVFNISRLFAKHKKGHIFPIRMIVKPINDLKNGLMFVGYIKNLENNITLSILTNSKGVID